MVLSVGNAVATLLLAMVLIPRHGAAGAVTAFAVPNTLVGFVGGSWQFFRKRREYAARAF